MRLPSSVNVGINFMKQFDENLYKQYDWKARAATKQYLRNKKVKNIKDNPDIYGPDLIIPNVCYIECEIKVCWRTKIFTHRTLQFGSRKKKFSELDMQCIFFVWNEPATNGLQFSSKILEDDLMQYVPNIEKPDGSEKFYIIPISKCKQVSI